MTYLLDTNVVSAARRRAVGGDKIKAWVDAVAVEQCYLSTITIMEIELGVISVERRDKTQGAALRAWLEHRVLVQFKDRILAIDVAVVRCCAGLHVPDRRSERDALIAATALVHGLVVVTRNVRDFKPTGVALINPWDL